jgi:4'-phosphopantetheinyl transferase EntD
MSGEDTQDPLALVGRVSGATAIAPLFGPLCVTEEAVPRLVDDELFPEERSHIARAVDKRRAEFGTARVCARRALARLGFEPEPLVPSEDRAPRWPAGIVGSITHTKGYCSVVVARAEHCRSVGLDAEQDVPLAEGLIEKICTPAERAFLRERAAGDAIVYFAAKEAYYKCQYPLTKSYLDFQDVELEVDFERATFRGRVIKPTMLKPAWLDRLEGSFLRQRGLVLCGLSLMPAEAGLE